MNLGLSKSSTFAATNKEISKKQSEQMVQEGDGFI